MTTHTAVAQLVEHWSPKPAGEGSGEGGGGFRGPAEREEEVNVDGVKSVLRRAGGVAGAEPVEVAPVVEPVVPPSAPTADEVDTGRRWYVIHTYSGYENKVK